MPYDEQIQRIKEKLPLAKQADPEFKVFGADSHEYEMGAPATEEEVRAFEEKYSISLPECYRSFLLHIGNGGNGYRKSAAGPFYGLYPFDRGVFELSDYADRYLDKPVKVEPKMTEEAWTELQKRLDAQWDDSEDGYCNWLGDLFAGILPIGSQGCTYLHAIVLNGSHRGRVVNLDEDCCRPRFAFEANFLDWYERWLDEVIAGLLQSDNPTWFGYGMGGDEAQLMQAFEQAKDIETKIDAIRGLARLEHVCEATCRKLQELCDHENADLRHQAMWRLTEFAYPMAVDALRTHIAGDDADCLAACQAIRWYAKDQAVQWAEEAIVRLPRARDDETRAFLGDVLHYSGIDYAETLKPFCFSDEEIQRSFGFSMLGELKNKAEHVELLAQGLEDPAPRVVQTTLYALRGVCDKRLVNSYRRVLERFGWDNYVYTSILEGNLKNVGYHSVNSFRMAMELGLAPGEEPTRPVREEEIAPGIIGLFKRWIRRMFY